MTKTMTTWDDVTEDMPEPAKEPLNPLTGTIHDGICENCDTALAPEGGTVEGELGFYCSFACCEDAEGEPYMSDAEARRQERKQMGFQS